jgi:hypothetical protein
MGLNPFREHRTSAMDVAMVIGALLLTVAVVAWALMG